MNKFSEFEKYFDKKYMEYFDEVLQNKNWSEVDGELDYLYIQSKYNSDLFNDIYDHYNGNFILSIKILKHKSLNKNLLRKMFCNFNWLSTSTNIKNLKKYVNCDKELLSSVFLFSLIYNVLQIK